MQEILSFCRHVALHTLRVMLHFADLEARIRHASSPANMMVAADDVFNAMVSTVRSTPATALPGCGMNTNRWAAVLTTDSLAVPLKIGHQEGNAEHKHPQREDDKTPANIVAAEEKKQREPVAEQR